MTTKGATEFKEKRVEAPPPAREFVARISKSHVKNMVWLLEHSRALAEYAGKWVVVTDREVRFSGNTEDEVVAKAEEAGLAKRDIAVHFVEDSDRSYETTHR